MNETKDLTWDDVIANFQKLANACKDENGNEDPAKFAAFKKQILEHLDKVEEAEKPDACFTKQYHINDYASWDDEVFNNVQIFYQKHKIYPNILLANKKTYAKIDEAVKIYGTEKLVYCGDEEEAPEFEGLSDFVSDEFALDFCLDEDMKTNYYKLVYDNDPTFDGEDIEDDVPTASEPMPRTTRYRYKLTKAA
jgi:hypothetical protein